MRRPVVLLAALMAVAVVAAACSRGGGAPTSTVTFRPTQVLPTSPPTATSLVIRTPVVLTPTPAALGGRQDCPQDWAAYNDPEAGFSLCYPAVLWGTAEQAPDVESWSIEVRAPEDGQVSPEDEVLFFAYWMPGWYIGGPGASSCGAFASPGEVSRQEGTVKTLGVDAPACFSEVHTITPGVGVTDVVDYFQVVADAPWPSGGFIHIRMAYRGPDFEASRATVMQMLDSVIVE